MVALIEVPGVREMSATEPALGVRGSHVIGLTAPSDPRAWRRRGAQFGLRPFHPGNKTEANLRPR